jgi:hypothetical protein
MALVSLTAARGGETDNAGPSGRALERRTEGTMEETQMDAQPISGDASWRRVAAIALLLALVAMAPESRGETVSIAPAKDTTLYEHASGALANGAGQYLFTGRVGPTGGNAIRRALLEFDVASAVPAGSTVDSVNLTMNMDTTVAGSTSVELRRVTAEWGEGASNALLEEGEGAAAAAGDATWLHTFFNTSTWAAAGGDFSGTVSSSVSVGNPGSYTWSTSAQLVADVQDWLDNPADNHGWIVIGNEASPSTAKRFLSREHPTVANRPELVIDFTPPPIPNLIAWPGGAQDFENLTAGDAATRIVDWSIVGGGAGFTVQAQTGSARPGSSSVTWLRVEDTDAAGSNRFYSAYALAPTTPTGYSWTMFVNLETTPPAAGSTRPKLAIQHQTGGGTPLTMWGIELRDTGAFLVTLDASEAVIEETFLYPLTGATAVGQWVKLEMTVDFDQGRIFAAFNDNAPVSAPIVVPGTVFAYQFRFCYRGNGTDNIQQLKFDDLTLSSGLNVPVEMSLFEIE